VAALEGLVTAAKHFQSSHLDSPPNSNAHSWRRPTILTFDSVSAAWRQVDLLAEAHVVHEQAKRD
jgi:hypothetical protein